MIRSPHKRGKRISLRVKEYKTTVSGNRGGNSARKSGRRTTIYGDHPVSRGVGKGSKVVMVPSQATQPPGYPSGKCLGAGRERHCRCGKHNR